MTRAERTALVKGLEAARREVERAGVEALSKVPAEAEPWCGLVATNILAAVSYRIRCERKKARVK